MKEVTEATSNQAVTRATLARERRVPAAPEQTMTSRTINYHGLDFHLAEADGELLDIDLDSADEFLEHHGDDFAEGRLDEGYSVAAMEKWAEDNLLADVQALIDWPMWSLAARNGVSEYPR